MRFRHWQLLGITLLILSFAGLSPAHTMPTTENTIYLPLLIHPIVFSATPTTSQFVQITDITNAGDDRLFVTEQAGRIQIMHPDGTTNTFLDINEKVLFGSAEQGLLGLAFHPNYATNGFFYVTYTGTLWDEGDRWVFLSRFHVSGNPNVADPTSEEELLHIRQDNSLHNGGGIAFNPLDGYLYLGVGDDSQFLVAQDSSSSKGKLLRVDVNTTTRWSQPWRDTQSRVSAELWALGLRNPWRFDIDPVTGDIFIGDVGDRGWEEVDWIPPGASRLNFGWPCVEGPEDRGVPGCSPANHYTAPIYYYSHENGCAVIAGKVYRLNPTDDGQFIFGDSCRRTIWSTTRLDGSWHTHQLGTIDTTNFLTAFGKDYEGNLYAGMYALPSPIYQLTIP